MQRTYIGNFSKTDLQTLDGHVKKFSTSKITREIKVKPTVRHHVTHVREKRERNVHEDLEEIRSMHNVGVNVDQCNQWKSARKCLKNYKKK